MNRDVGKRKITTERHAKSQEHAKALGEKYQQALRLAADFHGGLFVSIDKAGDKKEIIADSVECNP